MSRNPEVPHFLQIFPHLLCCPFFLRLCSELFESLLELKQGSSCRHVLRFILLVALLSCGQSSLFLDFWSSCSNSHDIVLLSVLLKSPNSNFLHCPRKLFLHPAQTNRVYAFKKAKFKVTLTLKHFFCSSMTSSETAVSDVGLGGGGNSFSRKLLKSNFQSLCCDCMYFNAIGGIPLGCSDIFCAMWCHPLHRLLIFCL